MIVEKMSELIGNTPMLKIPERIHQIPNLELYAKLELMNPFGSVKDRTALAMVEEDLDEIARAKKTIYENSSGNTAKALQAIAAEYDIPVKIVSGLSRVQEQKDVLMWLGSELEEFAAANDCFDPNDPNDPQYLIERAVAEQPDKVYFPSQFTNPKNTEIHRKTTGKEIVEDLGKVDYYFGGLGTTGSSLGIHQAIKELNPDAKCIGITGKKQEFIPGIRSLDQMWESGLFVRENYDEILPISEKETIKATTLLNRKLGLMCGPSSGAHYQAAVTHLREKTKDKTEKTVAVFMVCDRVEWYFSYIRERAPELLKDIPRPHSIAAFEFSDTDEYQVKVSELAEWRKKEEPIVIDVRSKIAYEMKAIDGAMNIPQQLFEKMIDEARPFPKDAAVLLVCAVGDKTKRLAEYLRRQGCNAYSLEQGMRGYSSAQLASAA